MFLFHAYYIFSACDTILHWLNWIYVRRHAKLIVPFFLNIFQYFLCLLLQCWSSGGAGSNVLFSLFFQGRQNDFYNIIPVHFSVYNSFDYVTSTSSFQFIKHQTKIIFHQYFFRYDKNIFCFVSLVMMSLTTLPIFRTKIVKLFPLTTIAFVMSTHIYGDSPK